jgi:hypothetical protein
MCMRSILITGAVVACTPLCVAPQSPSDPRSAERAIANALSAVPATIGRDATVLDWPTTEGGRPKTLRAGTNGWVCYPDMPTTPTNDPMCLDPVWQSLFDAWSRKAPFSAAAVGTAYMLQGASDASMTDPFLEAPAPGSEWLVSGPHVMLVVPRSAQSQALSTAPTDGGPYVMWEGTQYEHIMMPVG